MATSIDKANFCELSVSNESPTQGWKNLKFWIFTWLSAYTKYAKFHQNTDKINFFKWHQLARNDPVEFKDMEKYDLQAERMRRKGESLTIKNTCKQAHYLWLNGLGHNRNVLCYSTSTKTRNYIEEPEQIMNCISSYLFVEYQNLDLLCSV